MNKKLSIIVLLFIVALVASTAPATAQTPSSGISVGKTYLLVLPDDYEETPLFSKAEIADANKVTNVKTKTEVTVFDDDTCEWLKIAYMDGDKMAEGYVYRERLTFTPTNGTPLKQKSLLPGQKPPLPDGWCRLEKYDDESQQSYIGVEETSAQAIKDSKTKPVILGANEIAVFEASRLTLTELDDKGNVIRKVTTSDKTKCAAVLVVGPWYGTVSIVNGIGTSFKIQPDAFQPFYAQRQKMADLNRGNENCAKIDGLVYIPPTSQIAVPAATPAATEPPSVG